MRQHHSIRPRLVVLLVALSLACGASGCMTAEMWKRATETEMSPTQLSGFVTTPSDRHVPAAVVVAYSPTGTGTSPFDPVLAVPWDQAMSTALPPAPSEEDFARGWTAERSSRFQRDDPRYPGLRWATHMIEHRSGNDYCILSAMPEQANGDQRNQHLTLFLPATAQRPAANLAAAQLCAALLTPPAVVADAVLDPLYPVLWVAMSSSGRMSHD